MVRDPGILTPPPVNRSASDTSGEPLVDGVVASFRILKERHRVLIPLVPSIGVDTLTRISLPRFEDPEDDLIEVRTCQGP